MCVRYQARREMLPPAEEPDAWVDDLLAGRAGSLNDLQGRAKRGGYRIGTHYAVAYVPAGVELARYEKLPSILAAEWKSATGAPVTRALDGGSGRACAAGCATARAVYADADGLPGGPWRGSTRDGSARFAGAGPARGDGFAAALRPCARAVFGAGRRPLLLLLYRDRPEELQAFVDETLGPLLRHDAASPTPLMPTLRAFLAHGGRLRETAEAIFVHRNTLAYRLDRAAEVLAADLKDAHVRLSLEVALRALPLNSNA